MKKLYVYLGISFIFFLISSMTYPFLGKMTRYTSVRKSPVYDNFVDKKELALLPPAVPVSAISKKGTRIKFRYNNEEVWIEQSNLSELSFDSKNFSDTSAFFLETPIIDNQFIWFLYRNVLYTIDLEDTQNPIFKPQVSLPKIAGMTPSSNRVMWILSGEATVNNERVLNIALFNTTNRRFTPLTSFYGDRIVLEAEEFSKDNNYLSILVNIDGKSMVYVFHVPTQTLYFTQENVLGLMWVDSQLLIFTPKTIDLYTPTSIEWSKKKTLYSFKKNQNESPNSLLTEEGLLLLIDDKVYVFKNKAIKETSYRSLEQSNNGMLEYYQVKGVSCAKYKGKSIRSLSGKNPLWSFISILDEKHLLYRIQSGALAIIYLYNAETKESKPFRWIEDSTHVFDDHTMVEFVIENEEVWLFIEKPDEYADILQLHQLLK